MCARSTRQAAPSTPVAAAADTALSVVSLPVMDAALDRAGRIAFWHRLSHEAGRVSIMAALAAGVELHRAKAEVEHGMLLAWVERSCHFSARTAQRYMRLADDVLGDSLPAAIAEAALGTDAPRALIEEHSCEVESRTLSDLYADLGIVRRSSGLGGRRPGAGRPKADSNLSATEIEERAVADATTCATDIAHLLELFCAQEMWSSLDRANARIFARTLRDRLAIIAAGIESI